MDFEKHDLSGTNSDTSETSSDPCGVEAASDTVNHVMPTSSENAPGVNSGESENVLIAKEDSLTSTCKPITKPKEGTWT